MWLEDGDSRFREGKKSKKAGTSRLLGALLRTRLICSLLRTFISTHVTEGAKAIAKGNRAILGVHGT